MTEVSNSDLGFCPPGFAGRRASLVGLPDIRLVHVGCEPVHPRWQGVNCCNGYWRFYWVDSPGLSLTWKGGYLDYLVDAITVIPAWIPFTFFMKVGVGHAYLHVELPGISQPVSTELFPDPWSWQAGAPLHELRVLARKVSSSGGDDRLIALEAHALASRCIAHALERLDAENRRRYVPGPSGDFASVLERIESGMHLPITVAELAELSGYATESFIRAFRRAVGQTPAQFIIDRRIARAADMLSTGRWSMDEIARQCGFPNRRYLARMFSRRQKMTPSAFKRLHGV